MFACFPSFIWLIYFQLIKKLFVVNDDNSRRVGKAQAIPTFYISTNVILIGAKICTINVYTFALWDEIVVGRVQHFH